MKKSSGVKSKGNAAKPARKSPKAPPVKTAARQSGKAKSAKGASAPKAKTVAKPKLKPKPNDKAKVKAGKASKAVPGKPARLSQSSALPEPVKAEKPIKPVLPTRGTKAQSRSGTSLIKSSSPVKTGASVSASTKKRPTAKAENSPVKPSLEKPMLEIGFAPVSISKAAEGPSKGGILPEDDASLRKVMANLSDIFGGKDFLSDAELDAFLDSKMAAGEIPPSAALDPLDEAQSIIYEAWNTEGPQRIRLARRALETCPDCADAYVILAQEEAKDLKSAIALYRKGLEAGERALAPALFKDSVGEFWAIMETRPYMRARLGLAESLWEAGDKVQALSHLRDLMRLNPSDNQGVRYILAQCLLETGEEGELGTLLERFQDDTSPQIRYSHALWMFRREGDSPMAKSLFAEAAKSNPHVPAYLLKKKPFPKTPAESVEPGSDEEAAAYAMGAVETWRNTLGALDWLSFRESLLS